MDKRTTVAVVGGGASGIMAALQASKSGCAVTIFEKNDRIGKKILATGNGRCNFSNANMSADYYYADNSEFVSAVFDKYTNNDLFFFFKELGLLIKEKNGYYYPYSENASSVLDVLRNALEELEVNIITDACVSNVAKESDHFIISLSDGKIFNFDKVILATGGKAGLSPKDKYNGYDLLRSLNVSISDIFPALTQIKCDELNFKSLAGVRSDCDLAVLKDNEIFFKQAGEILFTDYGISGIVTFQVSHCVGELLNNKDDVSLSLDLLPQISEGDLLQFIHQKSLLHPDSTLIDFLTGIHNKKINFEVIKLAGFRSMDIVSALNTKDLLNIVRIYKHMSCRPIALNGFDKAQVTAGGVYTSELSDSMEVKNVKGLYITGELINVDGLCGGYNLQWAFSTGNIAGSAVAE